MKRVAREAVVISVPNFSSLPARIQVLFGKVPENNRPNKGHVYWFNWTGLGQLTSVAGLRISKLKTNVPREKAFLIGPFLKALALLSPNLFALSFVVRCEFI
jgi:hypothetical protein